MTSVLGIVPFVIVGGSSHSATRDSVITVVAFAAPSEARLEVLSAAHASPDHRCENSPLCVHLPLGPTTEVVVDRSYLESTALAGVKVLKNLLQSKGPGAILQLSELDPRSYDSIRSVLLRSPYGARYATAQLKGENPKIGVTLLATVSIERDGRSVELSLRPGMGEAFTESLAKDSMTIDKVTELAKSDENEKEAQEEVSRREPSTLSLFFVGGKSRLSQRLQVKLGASISLRIDEELERQERECAEVEHSLAAQWLQSSFGAQTWPPPSGSQFADLPGAARSAIQAELSSRYAELGFGSRLEAIEFLEGSRATFGSARLSISTAHSSANGTTYVRSFALDAIRF